MVLFGGMHHFMHMSPVLFHMLVSCPNVQKILVILETFVTAMKFL